jgi:hypothetical protein
MKRGGDMQKLFLGTLAALVISLSVFVAITLGGMDEVLKGLNGVHVVVENIDREIEQGGLTKTQLQTDVELRLRIAGVKVLSKDEWRKTKGRPILYVAVQAFKTSSQQYIFTIRVLLKEVTVPLRTPGVEWFADTWTQPLRYGISSSLDTIRSGVKDQVDIFIDDYLSANPKRSVSR